MKGVEKKLTEQVTHKSGVIRVKQSNDIAGIVIDVMEVEAPHMFPFVSLRYGIADALWDAGYRKVDQ